MRCLLFYILCRTIAFTSANGNNHLLRANSNIAGPRQRQLQLQHGVLPSRRTPANREYSHQQKAVNKSNDLNPNTLNTCSTTLGTLKGDTTKVSCSSKPEVRPMDTSNSSCVTVFTTSKSNDTTQSPNNTNPKEHHITTSLILDVKGQSETVISNSMSTISGNNTSYCTSIVKSKSEW